MIISTSSTILDYPGVSHHSNTRKPAPYTRPLQNETSSVNRTYETREAFYKETHFNYEHASPSNRRIPTKMDYSNNICSPITLRQRNEAIKQSSIDLNTIEQY
ncbi:hypothetical protein ACHWQZ_G001932 [Mnemiopsis leidyi]